MPLSVIAIQCAFPSPERIPYTTSPLQALTEMRRPIRGSVNRFVGLEEDSPLTSRVEVAAMQSRA
jgi:hypothetical protein